MRRGLQIAVEKGGISSNSSERIAYLMGNGGGHFSKLLHAVVAIGNRLQFLQFGHVAKKKDDALIFFGSIVNVACRNLDLFLLSLEKREVDVGKVLRQAKGKGVADGKSEEIIGKMVPKIREKNGCAFFSKIDSAASLKVVMLPSLSMKRMPCEMFFKMLFKYPDRVWSSRFF